jgi:hypothetical protein
MRQLAFRRLGLVLLIAAGGACRHGEVSQETGTIGVAPAAEPTTPPVPAVEVSAVGAAAPEARVAIAAPAMVAINPPGAAPRPPPALRRPPTLPNIPNLPLPSGYPQAAKPPRGPDVSACGGVWSGTEWIPLECAQPIAPDKSEYAATVVIPYEKMRAPLEQLPKIVDHRADGTEGPVRKQQGALCTAFAFTSALDHAYARWTGTPGEFSVMQVWGRYHAHQEQKAARFNVGDLITNESEWPYDPALANTWRFCHPNELQKGKRAGVDCGVQPDPVRFQGLDQKATAVITKVEYVPVTEMGVLREKLAAGQDVTLSLKLPSFSTAGDPGSTYILGFKNDDPSKPARAEHQVVLAGYAVTPNGTYYLVHNSFGTKWGDNGYAWLHEDFLKAFWSDNVMVIPYVEPVQVTTARADPKGGLSRECADGLTPDSISGICVARCPDGSPRHNDVCGSTAECPAGQINLTGECMLAAPTGSGTDPGSRVSWACGPGGCAYTMPRSVLGCANDHCAVSCPAPDFRLATTSRGFGCVD